MVKPDGRYLIYYSWPDETAAPAVEASETRDHEAARAPEPGATPWSPESGPPDV